MAIKIVPRIGIKAPTPAAALSLVRERNQLSIIGWKTPIPNVIMSGQERLKMPRSLTLSAIEKFLGAYNRNWKRGFVEGSRFLL